MSSRFREVDIERVPPVTFVDGLARARALHTRRRHDHAERPQLTLDARHEPADGAPIDDIDNGVQRTLSTGDEVAARHGEPIVHQPVSDCAADTTAGAGDDRHWLLHMTSYSPAMTLTDRDTPG